MNSKKFELIFAIFFKHFFWESKALTKNSATLVIKLPPWKRFDKSAIFSQFQLIFIFIARRKQFLWIKETFLWYTVKENISLNWRKFCWLKKIFFNTNKSISLDQRKFFGIKKTFFNSKKCYLSPYIKETVFSVWLLVNYREE